MRRLAVLVLLLPASAMAGCGAQQALLGTSSSYLFTVMDALALPGERVQLRARLQAGDLLQGQAGYVVRFYRAGRLFKAAETDDDGVATVSFDPQEPGDYRFGADVAPAGLADEPPAPRELLVACRKADEPIVVVDMDKTLVATGFETVLLGDPAPMGGSGEVLRRIARDRSILYLTHRPDYFGPKSKAWLGKNGYPVGPVLLSTATEFLKGSEAYKSEMLRRLGTRFGNVEMGIGDKVSDALAYHENGLKAFLILLVDETAAAEALEALAEELEALPEDVQVVTAWDQIDKALSARASYPPSQARRRLLALADARKKSEAPKSD